MTGPSSSDASGPARCYWCLRPALWSGRVTACSAHQADGAALSAALFAARWQRNRYCTPRWRKAFSDTINRSPDAWIIF
jgi:hypothetical protein